MEVDVLGGGYAGVAVTRRLVRELPADVDVTIIDRTGAHLIQHELHRLIRRPELESTLRIDLSTLVPGAEVREETVRTIDADVPCVDLADGSVRTPDLLVVCLGAETATYGLAGVAAHGIPLKRLGHAIAIRRHLETFGPADRVVVGGAGLSGIQVAGEIAAVESGPEVTIVEQQRTVAPGFPESFRSAVHAALLRAGVVIETGATVERATEDRLDFADGTDLPYDLFVWTGGITGSDAMGGERPSVKADLRLADRTFALGDAARVIDDRGNRTPAAAQTAVRQAPVAAQNVARLVEADRSGKFVFEPRMERYRYDSPGWAVSVGDDAVASVGDRVVSGRPANALKASIEAGYLGSLGRIGDAVEVIRSEVLGRSK